MRILVTGTKGQVSRCLQERAAQLTDVDLVAVGRPELNLLEPTRIAKVIASYRPDVVVSAAAYTAVDQAEEEPDVAFAVNEIGAGAVAAAARFIGTPVIHLSTDYVFSGELGRPYTEEDKPDPINIYGASKLAGEKAVAAEAEMPIILRTAWLYSQHGGNFVTKILGLARENDELLVVDDQWGNPTSAFEIADILLQISKQLIARECVLKSGIFHYAGKKVTNWSGLASEVMNLSMELGGPFASVKEIHSKETKPRTRRPTYSALRSKKILETYDINFDFPELWLEKTVRKWNRIERSSSNL